MKAMTRPCWLAPRSLLHTSSTCLNKPESPASLTKPSVQQQELDFFKAADILFAEEDPKRKKKFGWDFHLWQAFVACLPSVAVYFTAQYARYDMRRMEAEREKEAAEKRMIEEKKLEEESRKLPGFRTLHERLDKIEEKINEMESKTAQSTVALQEGKPEKVEKVETNVREGIAYTPTKTESDAKVTEDVTQNALTKREESKEYNKIGKGPATTNREAAEGKSEERKVEGVSLKAEKGATHQATSNKSGKGPATTNNL